MADHRAKQIFDRVVALLTGLATTGSNVFPHRGYAIPNSVNNALSIRLGDDSPLSDDGYSNMAFMDMELTIHVRIHTRTTEANLDDQLLLIRKEVHIALMSDRTLGLSFVHDTVPAGMGQPEFESQGEKPTLECDTNWNVRYRHSITDPSS